MNVTLYLLGLLGVAVFAVSGALSAGGKKYDLVGTLVVAVATAIGGGTIRDILLDHHPIFWIQDTRYFWVANAAALFTMIIEKYKRPPYRFLLYADAVGMALFTIAGTRIAEMGGFTPGVCVLMGCITGVAGGIIRDVLCGEAPILLRDREIYATAAIAGSLVYLALYRLTPIGTTAASIIGMVVIAAIRCISIALKVRIPVFELSNHPKP